MHFLALSFLEGGGGGGGGGGCGGECWTVGIACNFLVGIVVGRFTCEKKR